MADEMILRAEPRTVLGKKVGRLRREGLVPGVVYGPVLKETVAVSVQSREFARLYNRAGHSTIFSLEWESTKQPVLIREVQIDPVRGDHLHVDFFAPNMMVKLRQSVPVVLVNHNPDAQGVLTTAITEIEVEALPSDLPHQLEVDSSGLVEIGDTLKVSDITVPAGVEILTDQDDTIASLTAQAADEAEAAEEAAEAEEAATEAEAESQSGSDSE
jgi:large subunit ribosomal protein L25